MKILKILIVLGLSLNIFATEYSSEKAKEIYTTLNTEMNLGCDDKNCEFDLSYVSCSNIAVLKSYTCKGLMNQDDGVRVVGANKDSARIVFDMLSNLNTDGSCVEIMGIKSCNFSHVKCTKSTKLFISKYECIIE